MKGAEMEKVRKNFRISEDAAYDLETISRDLGITETFAIELALEVFYASGVKSAIYDLQSQANFTGYKDFIRSAYSDGKLRSQLRQNVGLELS